MTGKSYEAMVLVNPSQVSPVPASVVAAAESELGVTLPSGYATFVERYGAGAVGHFVRVPSPAELAALTREWRQRVQEFWFWDTAESGADPEALRTRGIFLADSFDGDELCFDPADPETLFVLPRNEDVAHRVGPGFVAALGWMLSGVLNENVDGWTFEASSGR